MTNSAATLYVEAMKIHHGQSTPADPKITDQGNHSVWGPVSPGLFRQLDVDKEIIAFCQGFRRKSNLPVVTK